MPTPELSATNLAYLSMTASMAGALFIAITIALTDRAVPRTDRQKGVVMLALTSPFLAMSCDLIVFITLPSGDASWTIFRSVIAALLLLSIVGLMFVLFTLPRRNAGPGSP